jgi:O-antigen/teichoic acid export membrane protein
VLTGTLSAPLCQAFGRFFGEGVAQGLHSKLVRALSLLIVLLLGASLVLELLISAQRTQGVFVGGVLLFGAQGLFDLSSQNSNVAQRAADYAAQALLKGGLLVALALGVARLPQPTYAALAAMILSFLSAAAIFSWRDWLFAARVRLDFDALRPVLRFALPLVGVSGLAALQQWSDRWLIAAFAGREQAGFYAATADLLAPVLLLIASTSYLTWYPKLVLAWDAKEKDEVAQVAVRHLSQTMFLLLPAAAGLVAVGPSLLPLALGPSFGATVTNLLPWLVAAGALAGFRVYVLDVSLYAMHRTHLLLFSNFAMLSAMTISNALLASRFGALGGAWSALISAAVGVTVSAWLGRRGVPWRMAPAALLQILLGCLAILLIVRLVPGAGVVAVATKCLAGAAAYGVVVFAFDTLGMRRLALSVLKRLI